MTDPLSGASFNALTDGRRDGRTDLDYHRSCKAPRRHRCYASLLLSQFSTPSDAREALLAGDTTWYRSSGIRSIIRCACKFVGDVDIVNRPGMWRDQRDRCSIAFRRIVRMRRKRRRKRKECDSFQLIVSASSLQRRFLRRVLHGRKKQMSCKTSTDGALRCAPMKDRADSVTRRR